MSERGKYIVIEGHDGTGKSTQLKNIQTRLASRMIPTVRIEEPAGVPIANELRTVIKNGELERDPTTDLLLFTAARREIHQQLILPSLEKGVWVLAARNWISTLAYQGMGDGIDPIEILKVTEKYTDDIYMNPDFVSVLSLQDEIERQKRISNRGELENPDTFESKDAKFQERVYQGYLKVADIHKLPVIDASPSVEEVEAEIWRQVEPLTEAA